MRLAQLFESSLNTIRWIVPKASHGRIERGEEVVVWVDVAKIDDSWKSDKNFYVGPNGTVSAIGQRYPRFGEWLKDGHPVEMSEICFDPYGRPAFGNGRHRFAWMRDHGAKALPIVTTADQADEFKAKFGSPLRRTVLQSPDGTPRPTDES